MICTSSYYLIKNLIVLDGSTTTFMEQFRSRQLSVDVISQDFKSVEGCEQIERHASLFFEDKTQPALYCTSLLNRKELTYDEYALLTINLIPIGRIFSKLNPDIPIIKLDTRTKLSIDHKHASLLKVKSPLIYKKQYSYWVGSRQIGEIIEYFNGESLVR